MAVVSFSSNTLSLSVQRFLGRSSELLAQSSNRLSSGVRINSASDDAAGLAIADSLRTASRKYVVANRNLNDGLSALNIVGNTLQSQVDILSRLQELAEQAANGNFSNTQRNSINREYQALVDEMGRMGETASFNGERLLLAGRSGCLANLVLQCGTDGSGNSQLNTTNTNAGIFSGVVALKFTPALNTGTFGFSGSAAPNSLTDTYGSNIARMEVTDSSGQSREVLVGMRSGGGGGSRWYFDVLYKGSQSDGSTTLSEDEWIMAHSTVFVSTNTTTGTIKTPTLTYALTGFAGGATATLNLDVSGLRRSDSAGTYGPYLGDTTAIDASGVEDSTRALHALGVARRRQEELGVFLGQIGAFQSRISTSLAVNDIARENSIAAESRIRDVDVAEETSAFVGAQISQQIGVSILAQANQAPNILLGLIKNA